MILNKYDGMKPYYHSVLLIVFLLSLISLWIGFWGGISEGMPAPWTLLGIYSFVAYSSIVLGVLWMLAFKRPEYLNTVGIIGTILFSAGAIGISPLVTVIFIAFSSYVLGRVIIRKIFLDENAPHAYIVLEMAVGIGVYSTIIGLMAHYKVNYPITYAILLVMPIICSKVVTGEAIKTVIKTFSNKSKPQSPFMVGVIWYLFSIYLVTAAMPEVSADGLAMHLMIPAYMTNNHIWPFDPEVFVLAVMPMNGDWLFTLAHMFAGEYGAKLLNVGLLVLVAGLMWVAVEKVHVKRQGLLALVLFLSLPLTYLETGSLFVENTWAIFVLGVYVSISLYIKSSQRKMLLIAGMLAGFAIATKFTSILILFFFGVYLFWNQVRSTKIVWHWQTYCISILFFLVVGSIPYLNAYIQTGNPIFPFYNAIFKSSLFYTEVNFSHAIFEKGLSFDVLSKITFESWHYLEATGGAMGFFFLVLVPVAILTTMVSGDAITRQTLFIWFGFFLLLFAKASYLRYFYPAIPLVISTIVVSFSYLEGINKRVKIPLHVSISLLVLMNLLFFNSANWNYRDFPVHMVLDEEKRSQYIAQRSPIRSAVGYINTLPEQPTVVAFFSPSVIAGLRAKALSNNWYSTNFNRAIMNVTNSTELVKILTLHDVSVMVVDGNMSDKKLLSQLREVSDIKESFGYAEVRSLRGDFMFQDELLVNPDFSSIEGWNISNLTAYNQVQKMVTVNVTAPVSQAVPVRPGRSYMLTVDSKCNLTGEVRLQVNWLDRESKFINADIDVVPCYDSFESKSKILVAPEKALIGVIYGTSHDKKAVQIKDISFKQ